MGRPIVAIVEPDEEEKYLLAILDSPDGIDLAEFAIHDARNEDGCYRLYDYQHSWFSNSDMYQIDQGGRNLGKTESIKLRALAFPFYHPGKSMLLTAPELNHLRPLTDEVEKMLLNVRLAKEMLPAVKSSGIARQPHWQVRFKNGTSIISRLPNKDGRGVKAQHVVQLEIDEASDYPAAGWREVVETLNAGDPHAMWRCHGVSRGVRDSFYEKSQPGSGWTVHRPMAMNRPSWSKEERDAKIAEYGGSRQSVDYKRNIYGEHGDASSSVFVLAKLMNCHPVGTPIWIYAGGKVYSIPVEDVAVGMRLPTAAGEGVVQSVRSQARSDLARVVLDGERIYCTSGHPWLTRRGWVDTVDLLPGDVVLTAEDMRDLWNTPALVDAATLLLAEVLGCGRSRDVSTLSGVWRGDHRPATPDLLQGLRGGKATVEESSAGGSLPELWNIDTSWEGYLSVLWDGVRLCLQDRGTRNYAVQELRRRIHGEAESAVLLALVCVELEWKECSAEGPSDVEILQDLRRRVLPSQQKNHVLLEDLRGSISQAEEVAGRQTMPSMQGELQSPVEEACLLQQGLLVSASAQPSARPAETPPSLELRAARRPIRGAVRALDGAGRSGVGMAAGVLDLSDGGGSGCRLLAAGPCRCRSEDQCGARWQEPQSTDAEAYGQGAGRLAGGARVDSVEILQPGDPDFDRLSGGKDHVDIYFLKVAGHPSYFVGERMLCSHNCVDLDEGSTYNSDVYTCIKMELERFPSAGATSDAERAALIHSWVDVPGEHFHGYSQRVGNTQVGSPNGYSAYWAGMDVGVTNHPSEILVFGQRTGTDFLELLTRVHMQRINVDDQMLVVERLFALYGDRLRFGVDRTGVGFPLWDQLTRRSFGSRVYGFGFSEKRVAGFEDRDLLPGETQKDLARYRNMVEASTDWLRNDYIDVKRFRLPYDREVLIEFQGQSYSIIRDNGDPYGVRRQYSGGSFHTLDSAKVAIATKHIPPLEAMLEARPTQAPVLDVFMGA